jgi:stress response protein YsnF
VVREEVVLRKERAERVEEINETVRRTEVEVDETSSSGTGRTG